MGTGFVLQAVSLGQRLSHPFRVQEHLWLPGALPQAMMFQPFRLKTNILKCEVLCWSMRTLCRHFKAS